MSSIFLLYEGQVLPVRYRPNARARGLKLTCSLGGDLLLTSPPDTPRQALYRFLEANRDRIGRQVMAARQRAEALPQPEEDVFVWLGEPLPVIRKEGARSQARLKDGRVLLSMAPGDWPHEALERLRQRLATPFLAGLAQERAEALGLTPIAVAVRPMFSRYGSCQPDRRRLCLNSYLTRMPRDVILSVVDHELCHLSCPGHDEAFYQALYHICPKYAHYRERLKRELSPYLVNIRLNRRARRPHPALNDFDGPIL